MLRGLAELQRCSFRNARLDTVGGWFILSSVPDVRSFLIGKKFSVGEQDWEIVGHYGGLGVPGSITAFSSSRARVIAVTVGEGASEENQKPKFFSARELEGVEWF